MLASYRYQPVMATGYCEVELAATVGATEDGEGDGGRTANGEAPRRLETL